MSDGEVFGLDKSPFELERLAFLNIRAEWLEIERTLLGGKWFDYRFLHPTAATYLFAHEYKKAYRRSFAINIDSERAEFITPLPEDLFAIPDHWTEKKQKAQKTLISGIWRARQVADAMGIPYAIYLERAYHWATRYWRQRHLPRPQQIYSDLVTDRTTIDWDEMQAARLYYSELPQFNVQVYDERVEALNAHHEYLFAQLANRGNNLGLLGKLLVDGLLPAAKVEARLGADVMQSALAA